MKNSHHFIVGYQQFAMLPPDGVTGMDAYRWMLENCKQIGAHAVTLAPVLETPEDWDVAAVDVRDKGRLQEMAAMAKEADVHFIMTLRAAMSLSGKEHPLSGAVAQVDPAYARRWAEKAVEAAEIFGVDTFGCSYGRLQTQLTRYNKAVPYQQVKEFVKGNLTELAQILRGTGMVAAYENHCDFKGKEIAQILEEVNAPEIGSLYDIGNGATICCDAMDDVDALAPWAVAAHFKDFKMVNNSAFRQDWQDMPMILKGCLLGEGYLDFDVIMKAIIEKAPKKKDMILLAEPAFILPETEEDRKDIKEFDRKCSRQFVRFMLDLVDRY